MLQKLTFKPGINKDLTRYAGEGSWFDCDKVRFVNGLPQKMGGWVKINSLAAFSGICRSLFNWLTLDSKNLLSLGTSTRLLLEEGGGLYNITPLRVKNTSLAANPFTSGTAGTGVVKVTHPAHGALEGDTVIFSGATAFDGITADEINTSLVITQINDSNSYYVDTGGSCSSGSTAGGGSSVLASYEINTGAATSDTGGIGWGAGFFGGTVSGATTTTLSGAINDSVTTIPLTDATGFDTASTTLTADLEIGDGEISLTSVSGFPWVGVVQIGSEQIRYEYVDATNNKLSAITRGMNGTTEATHTSGASATYVGTVVINNEIVTYTGVSVNSLTGAQRGQFGTSPDSHSSGDNVVESNEFTAWGDGLTLETGTSETITVRLWRQDNFGEDLLANIWGGGIYYWDASSGFNNRAVALSSLSGSADCPTVARIVLVSDNDRHVVALGCDDSSGVFDPLLIRWADQESLTDWTPATTNTAGDLQINNGSEIITAQENRQEILVWTDKSLHSLRFVGAPFTFGQTLLSQNVTIISPNAHIAVGDAAFWMGNNNFYLYDGRVTALPCSVRNFVFQDLNFGQRNKFFAGSNYEFGEVIWFYVSSSSTEIDRYVIYNFVEKVWYTGSLGRTAWIDRSLREYPIAASTDNYVYTHDNGLDDGSQNPPVGITAFIESSDFEIGDGDRLQFASRVIPDLSFNGSSASEPSATFSFAPRNFPGDAFGSGSSSSVTATQTVDVEQFTDQAFIRLRGREMSVKVESTGDGVFWRLGAPRIDVRPDGRR